MKAPQTIALAVSCFLAGFLTCYFLTQQPQPKPASVVAPVAAPMLAPVAMLTLPTVLTQEFRIDGGTWYQWPDGTMQRTAPPEMRGSYFDLIDFRYQPDVDLRDLK